MDIIRVGIRVGIKVGIRMDIRMDIRMGIRTGIIVGKEISIFRRNLEKCLKGYKTRK